MPRLSLEQREQAIGSTDAKTSTHCTDISLHPTSTGKLYTTNSTNDRTRSRLPRVTKKTRQNKYILQQHVHNWFTRYTQKAWITIGNHQRPIVRRRLIYNNIIWRRLARWPILSRSSSTGTSTRDYVTSELASSAVEEYHLLRWKSICIFNADSRTRVWQRRGKLYADACIMQRPLWCGPNIMFWKRAGLNMKLGPVIFQNIRLGRGNGVTAARPIDQVWVPTWCHFSMPSELHSPAWQRWCSFYKSHKRLSSAKYI